jgi:signal transduction histidine kinase
VINSHPGVKWETQTDGALPELPLSETSFVETLVILLRNAVEAMQGEGCARLECCVSDGDFSVVVLDEGPGFDSRDISMVFKPGYTTKAEGSGYGLFLARRMVEEHGGRIIAESRSGPGARVEVRLPVA